MGAEIYAKLFGLGVALGGTMEFALIKSNYYEMLLASEAKAKRKELNQEAEDIERMKRIREEQTSQSQAE
ncbi:hypothetical protein BC940DRAFT_305416 [Gongronella butleri]|nr:hypothetical protein BC940DRAFT_305416 [Gongronella butleri]